MLKVMIVDDLKIMRHIIKKQLEQLGYEIIAEATSGIEALSLYKSLKPNIVTMDIMMPGENGVRNGLDSLKLIKKFDNDANIIIITSDNKEESVKKALSAGAKGYILKPTDKERLKTVLDNLNID